LVVNPHGGGILCLKNMLKNEKSLYYCTVGKHFLWKFKENIFVVKSNVLTLKSNMKT